MTRLDSQIAAKKALVFGFDDVIYPEKDYLLQVYYLFSEFMAYNEQADAKTMIAFMQGEYASSGTSLIFEKTADKFQIPAKYHQNFVRLHETARLPLKLLMYQQILSLMQDMIAERKEIILLVDGNPMQQLNKIKQIEWHGMEQYLRVYFLSEFNESYHDAMTHIKAQHVLSNEEILMVGNAEIAERYAHQHRFNYLSVKEILSNFLR